MDTHVDVAVVVGSLRKESFNLKLAKALVDLAPDQLQLERIPIGQLPLYNQDYDEDGPSAYGPFRERIQRCDAVLFVTPEHNRSMPAALKNALDVGSRPYGQNVWDGKPAGIVTASISAQGGFGANHHLRQSLTFLNMPMLLQPEVYIGHVQSLLNDDGVLENEDTRQFLDGFLESYASWVKRLRDG